MSDNTNDLSVAEADAATKICACLSHFGAGGARRVLEHLLAETEGVAESDVPMFARGIAGPLGKLDCDLKTKVDERTDAQFRSHCALVKSDTSSVLRDCVYAVVYKQTYSQMVADKLIHDAKRNDAMSALTGLFEGLEFGEASHG